MEEALITDLAPEEELRAADTAVCEGTNDTSAATQALPESEDIPLPTEAEEETEEETPDARFARTEQEDLAALRAALPELASLASLTEISSPARYGELRELGLSPLEAYLASEGKRALGRAGDSRAHLVSSIGRTAATGSRIGSAELSAARDLFPSLSDSEIEALWRRVEQPRRR